MVIRITSPTQLEMQFKEYDRDYFSYEGYENLLDVCDGMNPDWELDVIAICEEWAEYGPEVDGSYDRFIQDYGDALDIYDWARDEYEEYEDADDENIQIAIDNGDIDIDGYYDALAEALEVDTEVIGLANGDFLIAAY